MDIAKKEEKIEKASKAFSLLPEEKQDYILGILQALNFAKYEAKEPEKPDSSSVSAEC